MKAVAFKGDVRSVAFFICSSGLYLPQHPLPHPDLDTLVLARLDNNLCSNLCRLIVAGANVWLRRKSSQACPCSVSGSTAPSHLGDAKSNDITMPYDTFPGDVDVLLTNTTNTAA
jgi:hypothetical protein